MRHSLLCIINNACKHTKQGQINIVFDDHVIKQQSMLRITITDTGDGISQQKLDELLALFSPSTISSTKKFVSLGSDLYMAKTLVETLSGVMTISSQPEQGTTFEILLPTVYPNAKNPM
ncbi:MAG: hypothetical protein Tsb005_12290 [Gammaproteobacteria bacterium]